MIYQFKRTDPPYTNIVTKTQADRCMITGCMEKRQIIHTDAAGRPVTQNKGK